MPGQHGGEIYSRSESVASETTRGFDDYAEEFGMSSEELDAFLVGTKVLDMGSGRARFALDIAVRKLEDASYRGPERVHSLNVQYSKPAYISDWYASIGKDVLKGYRQRLGQEKDTALKEELKKVATNALALDWNELLRVKEQGLMFDRIVSCNGFPRYSDFITRKEDSRASHPVAYFSFGDESKKVFADIATIMTPGGKGLFTIDWDYEGAGSVPVEFQKETEEILQSLGFKNVRFLSPRHTGDVVLYLEKEGE